MTVDTNITLRDFRAFVAFVGRQGNPILRLAEPVLCGVGCGLVLDLLGWLCHIEYNGETMLITLFASISTVLLWIRFRSRRLLPAPGGLVLGEKHITLSPEGLRQSSAAHDSLFRWPLVSRIAETSRHIFVMLDRNAGVIIPRSSFPTPQECAGFLAELKKLSGKP